MSEGKGRALSRGDRRRNERLARLRGVVRRDLAVVAVDLAKASQAVVVMDHDSRVIARRLFDGSSWGLDEALEWGERLAYEEGLSGIVVACEPTDHFWKPLVEMTRERGVGMVLVQPLLVARSREAEDLTRDKSDFKDATIIGRLAAQLRCYLSYAPDEHWARLRHLGCRRDQLMNRVTAASQSLRSLLEVGWPTVLETAAEPSESVTWRAAMTVTTDPEKVAAMPYVIFEKRLRRNLAGWGGKRPCLRICRAIWGSAKDPGGIGTERAAVAERAGFALADWQRSLTELTDVEDRMVGVLEALGLVEIVSSIRGVSAVSASAILAETGDPDRYDSGRAWVKHAGLAPRDNESGSYRGTTTISGRGRPRLRTATWRAVWGALRHNEVYAARYQHLTTRQHNPLSDGQARAALGGSLLRQLHAICTKRVAWDPAIATGHKAVSIAA